MIDLFKVIYGWWALHLFSMFFVSRWPTFGGFFHSSFDLLETHQDDQEGATLTHVMEKFVSFGV